MPNRVIKPTAMGGSTQLLGALSSLFALELFAPSPEIYLFSPWVTDIPLLRSQYGQFRSLVPDVDRENVRLSDLLIALATRGSHVYVAVRGPVAAHTPTGRFMYRLSERVNQKVVTTLHEKGLITAHFYLRGSMNFTSTGLHRSDEHVELETDLEPIAYARTEAKQRWESWPNDSSDL